MMSMNDLGQFHHPFYRLFPFMRPLILCDFSVCFIFYILLQGDLPVGKTKKGGFLGFGGEEDGGVTVNGARILESFEVTNCVVHEVDDLVHPKLLWRYMDQLRIPGT